MLWNLPNVIRAGLQTQIGYCNGGPDPSSGPAGIEGNFEDALASEQVATRVMYDFAYPRNIDKIDFRAIYRIEEGVLPERRSIKLELPSYSSVEDPNSLAIRNGILDRMGVAAFRKKQYECPALEP